VFNDVSRVMEDDRMRGAQKVGLFVAFAAAAATAACGNRGSSSDDDLASDLQLAPRGGSAQTVVSAIEAGPKAAPVHAAHKPVAKPASHPAPLRAAPQRSAPAPSAAVAQTTQPPAPSEKSSEPAPISFPDAQGAGRERQRGTYSTEAEIFKRMPWIRP
jgi:hypothetical protein